MFKAGQKVVFIFPENWDPHDAVIAPKNNEIVTLYWYHSGKQKWAVKEYIRDKEGDLQGFASYCFRPIDHSFGENLAEEIEQEINEEQLILK